MSYSFHAHGELLRRHPAFARVFWADAAAQVGQNMLVVAFPTLILEVTHDLTLTGLSFTAEILAYALLSPLAGWLADRWPQKPLMLLANGVRFSVLLLLLWTLAQGYPQWFYLLLSLALGAAGALFSPARAAWLRRLLQGPDLLQAVTLEGTCGFLIRLVAPGLMGLILLVSDARTGIALDACSYLLSSLLLIPVVVTSIDLPPSQAEGSWKEGWRILVRSADLRRLLAGDLLISFLGMASWSTAVAYLEAVLQVRAANNGWLQAAMGLTGAWGTRWVSSRRKDQGGGLGLQLRLLALVCFSYLLLGYCQTLPQLVLAWSIRGFGVGALVVLIAQQLAREVPPSSMGRVQAAWEQAILLACFAGSAMTPWLLRQIGPLWAFRLYGVGFLLLWLLGLLWSRRSSPKPLTEESCELF